MPETDTPIETLENRLETLEKLVNECLIQISELHERLDQPARNQEFDKQNGKPKAKAKQNGKQPGKNPKGPSPAERILSTIGASEMTRYDVYEKADLSKEQGNKAWDFLVRRKLVEKTGEKEGPGRSLWKVTGKKL